MKRSLVLGFLPLFLIACGGGSDGGPTTESDTSPAGDTAVSEETTPTDSATEDTAVPEDTSTPADTATTDTSTPPTDTAVDTSKPDTPTGATFTMVYAMINSRCGSCHKPSGGTRGGLDMSTKAKAYAELVNVKAEGGACGPTGKIRVVPFDPPKSLLHEKIAGTPSCGSRMPQGGSPLPPSEVELVRSWIAAGAKND